ncbi:MAG: hypothetical protein LBT47_08075 [Deltaproteobacteria bacterium]|jgi:DNA polymerase-3 subunit delta'|nr:hypothetical protein [Deltaproteobacteria bacterium]
MPWPLIGLDHVKKVFSDMLEASKLPHAILLTGLTGCGKYSLSIALAQALNCYAPDHDFSPCLKCESCRKTQSLNHPDVTVLEPKGRLSLIPIDDVRDLRSSLKFKPFEGRYKVAIIRGADNFREESGGALLKTLEEPTPNTILILNAISEAAVMATLVSRCVRIKVPPLPRTSIVKALTERGLESRHGALMAGLSGGTMGEALNLDAQKALTVWDELDALFGLYGSQEGLDAAFDWTSKLASEIAKLKKKEETFVQSQSLLELILKTIRLWWRDTTILAATGENWRLLGPSPSPAQTAVAKTLTAAKFTQAERYIERLADGLGRAMRLEIIFENYWLDVLE